MDALKIEQTNTSPFINLNPELGIYVFAGYSRPENVREFYIPIIDWLINFKNELIQKKKNETTQPPVSFDFQFVYFNSASAKFLYDVIIVLNEIQKEKIDLTIRWHYDEDDDELREAGEELSELAQVPFKFIQS